MYTTDQLIGEIVRNPNDAEDTFRGWLEDRLTEVDSDVEAVLLADDLRRVLPAWDLAIEIDSQTYAEAEALALACDDPEHAERFPDQNPVGSDVPAHVAVHVVA